MATQPPTVVSPGKKIKKDWQVYSGDARDKAAAEFYYIKVEPRKTGNLHITGAKLRFKTHPGTIYNSQFRIAGTEANIRAYMVFQRTSPEALNSPLRNNTADQIIAGAFTEGNYAEYKSAIDQEIANYRAFKGTGVAGASISLEDSSSLLRASGGLSGHLTKKIAVTTGKARKKPSRKPKITHQEKEKK